MKKGQNAPPSLKSRENTLHPNLKDPHEMHEEEYEFLSTLGRDSRTCLDIGSYHGNSALALANAGNIVFTVDDHREFNSLAEFSENIRKADGKCKIIPFIMTSEQAFRKMAKEIMFDLILIDGSHKYEDVLRDFILWFPRLKVGGVIIFHDSFYKDVNRVIYDILLSKNVELVKIFKLLTVIRKIPNLKYLNGSHTFDFYTLYHFLRSLAKKFV